MAFNLVNQSPVDNEFIIIGTAMTDEFTGNSNKKWRIEFGAENYPNAREILICVNLDECDVNAFRTWAWGLQRLFELTRSRIDLSHYPAGILKWYNGEHRMVSDVTIRVDDGSLEWIESEVNLID